jgi:lipid-binding SYLF domain-containing protein
MAVRGKPKEEVMKRKILSTVLIPMALCLVATGATAATKAEKAAKAKSEIDSMAETALDRLFAKDAHAKSLFDMSYGYAIFDNLKIIVGVSGSGGSGVAIVRGTGQRVYMKMGSGGLGLGLGGQRSQIIFLFQDKKTMEDFVYKGWQGDASANAVAGIAGANSNASFEQGIVLYQLTESGLMVKADVSGTKFWVNKKLNNVQPQQSNFSTATSTNSSNTFATGSTSSEEIEPNE